MRVSLVLEPPATLAVLSEINSLQSRQYSSLVLLFASSDVRLEVGELRREVILGLAPQLGGLLRWL